MRRSLLLLAAGAALVLAGCNGDGGRGLLVRGPAALLARGSGTSGSGGRVSLAVQNGLEVGLRSGARIRLPGAPRPRRDAIVAQGDFSTLDNTSVDFDPEEGSLVVAGDLVVPAGEALDVTADAEIVSTQGNIFVLGTIALDEETAFSLVLGSRNGAIVIGRAGEIYASGAQATPGKEVELAASRVYLQGEAEIDASGGDGQPGGSVTIHPFSPIEVGPRAGVHCEGSTAILADAGPAPSDVTGPGGTVRIDYAIPGLRSHLGLGGTISAGGLPGGQVLVYWGGTAVVGGSIDTTGFGSGGGADGGQILFGAVPLTGPAPSEPLDTSGRASSSVVSPEDDILPLLDQSLAGAGQKLVLLAAPRGVSAPAAVVDVSGGEGGSFAAASFAGGIRWGGRAAADGGGGILAFTTFGRRANIRFDGSAAATGGDTSPESGGVIVFFAADGSLDVRGTLDASGSAAASGSDQNGGPGGIVALLCDWGGGEEFPDFEREDGIGGAIRFEGQVLARGGSGDGSGNGGNGGTIAMDADPDDLELSTHGGGRLVRGSLVDVSGGAGATAGDGGQILLRASDRSGDPTSTAGFTVEDPVDVVGYDEAEID